MQIYKNYLIRNILLAIDIIIVTILTTIIVNTFYINNDVNRKKQIDAVVYLKCYDCGKVYKIESDTQNDVISERGVITQMNKVVSDKDNAEFVGAMLSGKNTMVMLSSDTNIIELLNLDTGVITKKELVKEDYIPAKIASKGECVIDSSYQHTTFSRVK